METWNVLHSSWAIWKNERSVVGADWGVPLVTLWQGIYKQGAGVHHSNVPRGLVLGSDFSSTLLPDLLPSMQLPTSYICLKAVSSSPLSLLLLLLLRANSTASHLSS